MLFSKPNAELSCKGVETDEELRLANDLMAKVHMADYFAALNWLETCGAGYPGFRREHTRIALWRGELAGALRMNTETIRLGEARLKTGGLGWVTTEPRHRKKGICRALIIDTLDYMRHHGYHLSLLFGIPNFYHRFGFATALSDYAITVECEELASLSAPIHKVRHAKPGDIPSIQRIHNANDNGVACSLIRNSAHLTNKWAHCGKTIRVLANGQGKVVAYFMARKDGGTLVVEEVGIAENASCESVLAACAHMADDEAAGRIRFLVPPPHPFAHFLLQYKSIHEMRVTHDEGGMLAFVNLSETLESMTPEWERLIADSSLRDARAELTLLAGGKAYRIRANRGAIDVAAVSGRNRVSLTPVELMYLVTGCRHVEDVLSVHRRILAEETRRFLAVLFPRRAPYVWTFDRF